jgi:hypothetical protein
VSELLNKAARALCLSQFSDPIVHGSARCCQAGGTDGCCIEAVLPQAASVLSVVATALADIADRESYAAAQAIMRECRTPAPIPHDGEKP